MLGVPIKKPDAALIFLLVIGVAGCGKKDEKLATVDGKAVTQAEFDAYLKFKRLSAPDDKRRDGLLDQYLDRAALAAAIEKTKVLDKELMKVELEEFRKEMLINRYFEKYLQDKVADDAARNYYNTHASDYEESQVHVAHILIRTNPNMSEPERKAKLTTAQDVYSQIRGGKEFAAIAEQYSEDKVSAKNGGDLGWVKQGGLDANFSKAAFETKEGELSEPFETPFGYHVIKVLEAPRTEKRPFESMAGDIRYRLKNEAKKAELDRLKESVKVKKCK
ncbi:MAG: peptidylprolyl isomerase [Desulfobacteraceae bacterium]|nr:peptidylprolyl isomerase [Desulfobacteraceae bacterium]